MILAIILLILLLVLAYAWVGYPMLLSVLARWLGGKSPAPAAGVPVSSVAILFSAHNEEAHIAARLRNLLDACEGLVKNDVGCRVLVGADGCTDSTVAIADEWASRHPIISVIESPRQGGKIRMLKELADACPAEVLVFTDANTEFMSGALDRLLHPFFDPAIGCVCGRLEQVSGGRVQGSGSGEGKKTGGGAASEYEPPEGFYWRWENRLKKWESDLDSCLGVNGAIYAARRELFWRDVPDNTVVDDFVLGMKVREKGARVLYEPLAVAAEELPDIGHEWRRRVRIGAGDFQALALCRRCLLPRYGWFAWSFLSHKVLRWFTPHVVIVIVLLAMAGISCAGGFVIRYSLSGVLASFAGFLAMALAGRRARGRGEGGGLIGAGCRLADHFLTMQAAVFAGWLRYLAGDLKGHWTRTPRKRTMKDEI